MGIIPSIFLTCFFFVFMGQLMKFHSFEIELQQRGQKTAEGTKHKQLQATIL